MSDLTVKGSQVSSLTEELAARDRRIASLSAKINNPNVTYRKEVKPLSNAVDDTVGRITARTAFGAKRNVAAMFGESIPLVGVGVAVAVTGYELKDNCDNLKDLRELELSINPSLAYPSDVQEVCGMQVPSKAEVWSTVYNSPSTAWATTKEYMPSLPEFSVTGGLDMVKQGSSSAWQSTKDTAATMRLGWDYNWDRLFGE